MENKDKIIELIQNCLNLGRSPNEHEASAAMAKAQELLEKYNLTLGDLSLEDRKQYINMVNIPIPIGRAEWKRRLLHYIAQDSFCKVVISGKDIHVLGRETNVYSTLVMGSWIITQLENLAWLETTTYNGPVAKLKFRDSFLWGAIDRVKTRLREERKGRENSNPNLKALIVNLSEETGTYTKTQFGFLSTHHVDKSFSPEAYGKGQAAGNKVSLYGSDKQLTPNHKQLT